MTDYDDPFGEEIFYDRKETARLVVEKMVKKWAPILDALKVEDNSIRILMSEYAERHTLDQNVGYGSAIFEQNTLPISMRIFSKLNLENKNIIFRSNLPTTKLSTELTPSQFTDIKSATGMDTIQKMEKVLMDKLVDHINSELENKNTINIQLLINSIDVVVENVKLNDNQIKVIPKMHISGNFSFE